MIMKKIKEILYRIYLSFPASKREVLNARYELKLMMDAVKEIEALNRTNITTISSKLLQMQHSDDTKKETKTVKNDRGQYQ